MLPSSVVQFAVTMCLIATTVAVDSNCDYYQDMPAGSSYNINSPNYPYSYPPNINCRWYAVSPPGSKISFTCNVFNISSSLNCDRDRLSISPTGAIDLADAQFYCGYGNFQVISIENKMNIELYVPYNTYGGVFSCVIAASNPTTTTTTTEKPGCACGWKKETRIVGGEETGVNEFPMMAGLVDLTLRRIYCGCTIISQRYIATAAHCVYTKQVNNIRVLVGEHNISTGNETGATELLAIWQFIVHPQYDTTTEANDIALIKMQSLIQFSLEVGPACLPWRIASSFAGDSVEVLGWGSLEFGGVTSDTLQKATLQVWTVNQCIDYFQSGITSKQMCTHNSGKDACQSDSGGPVLWLEPTTNRECLVGIISYGINCATSAPGVNTRITSYLNWISDMTPDGDYCVL